MKNKIKITSIEITSTVCLDEIREQLISMLTPEEIVQFFISFYEDICDPEDLHKLLLNKLSKVKI